MSGVTPVQIVRLHMPDFVKQGVELPPGRLRLAIDPQSGHSPDSGAF